MSQPTESSPLANQLRDVKVGLRRDLDLSRQVLHGRACYVLRDGISFQSHCLTAQNYHIVMALRTSRTVGEAFQELVAEGKLKPEREDEFYQFVVGLHQRGLLHLPTEDPDRLYARLKKSQSFSISRSFMQLISLKIPVGNPDRWLDQVLPLLKWFFHPVFFVAWCAAVILAIGAIAAEWSRFQQPMESLLAVRNVVLTIVLVLVLKAWHEIGHAVSCKHFGGAVPEWGAILIVGTPCAYVDTSSAWGFHRRLHRVIVNMAGMYFESLAALLAVAVWIMTEPGMIHSIAHHTILIATVVTLLFNLNPLIKFDGYYVLSDWLGLPNLKQLADRATLQWGKFLSLGLVSRPLGRTKWEQRGLVAFGVASALYRTTIIAGLFLVIAYRLPMVGLFAGCCYVVASVLPWLMKITAFLWASPETEAHRIRAVTVWFALITLPLSILIVPWTDTIHVAGVVKPEQGWTIRAQSPGFLAQVHVKEGDEIVTGQQLCSLTNADLELAHRLVECRLEGADVNRIASLVEPQAFTTANRAVIHTEAKWQRAQHGTKHLEVLSSVDAFVLRTPADGVIGKFFNTGEPMLELGSGEWLIKTLLTSEQLADSAKQVGDSVEFTTTDARLMTGVIRKISPVGEAPIKLLELTQLAGGNIVVSPETLKADQPYFEMVIAMENAPASYRVSGARFEVHLSTLPRPIASVIYRRWLQFLARYRTK